MNKLNLILTLKGNQAIAYRQLLKTNKWSIFVDDVCNFTDLTPCQARNAFNGLIKKGLVENVSNRLDVNQYRLTGE